MPKKIIVLDTSIVLAYAKEEAHWREIDKAIGRMQWIAPPSLHFEVGNALAAHLKGHKRRKKITLVEAQVIMARYGVLPVGLADFDMGLALEIMAEENMWAYDAYAVTLALQHGLPLATGDHPMRVHAENLGLSVLYFDPNGRVTP